MWKNFKSPKLPTLLFVVASLATFVLFGIIFIIGKMNTAPRSIVRGQPAFARYYLNENYGINDPYITKNPDLADMLSGPIISGIDPVLGQVGAPVALVEFSDYTCDYCKRQEDVIRQILDEFEDEVFLVWKDYPEGNPASDSWQTARAARCAHEQETYWEYHDLLYGADSEFSTEFFLILAKKLRIDVDEFSQCVSDRSPDGLIQDNIEEANALGINGVPYLYVNDREVLGSVTYEELKGMVEFELDKIEQ